MDDVLSGMAAEGKTAREIGEALGVTRNSVIGRAGRTGVKFLSKKFLAKTSQKGIRKGSPRRPKPAVVEKIDDPVITQSLESFVSIPSPQPEPEPDADVRFFDLRPHHCRYPKSGDGLAIIYCGNARDDARPYCPDCRKLAYVAPKIPIRRFAA
jgi:hypothetical protein